MTPCSPRAQYIPVFWGVSPTLSSSSLGDNIFFPDRPPSLLQADKGSLHRCLSPFLKTWREKSLLISVFFFSCPPVELTFDNLFLPLFLFCLSFSSALPLFHSSRPSELFPRSAEYFQSVFCSPFAAAPFFFLPRSISLLALRQGSSSIRPGSLYIELGFSPSPPPLFASLFLSSSPLCLAVSNGGPVLMVGGARGLPFFPPPMLYFLPRPLFPFLFPFLRLFFRL